MTRVETIFLFLLLGALVFGLGCNKKIDNNEYVSEKTGASASELMPDKISFNYHVKPILSDRCFKCHGPDKAKIEAGLSLNTLEDATIALGENLDHYAIVPGQIERSILIDRIYSEDPVLVMPPPESNLSLTNYEKEILKKWIEQGAVYESHWSFNPLKNPDLPQHEEEVTAYNNIDLFIQQKLKNSTLSPSERATKEHLIRRVSFDVTGISPTLAEIEAYLDDPSDDAYEAMVDRFLSKDAYAENMAAMWMDIARYADTHGYQDDLERTMWPWRDWVLHAFKQNMPYDQFVKWQLAGDLLPEATKEQIIATGFNRNHKITQEGGVIPEEYLAEYVSDRTLTFGKAFLGLSVECAKCHDHKYDPISQEEYYSLFAFFNNVPEKGLIEEYGQTPEPYLVLTKEEIAEKLTFINNLDTIPKIELMVMAEQEEPRKTYILDRGLYDHPTKEVQPTTPSSVLSFDGYDKNRKGLADWLFSPDNPLTARVMVNRLWMICFGKGLVSTTDDFGAQGSLPSHPELLDHLAYKFIQDGWDIKMMMKYILLSYTYQQSSKATPQQLEIDPQNMLYARGARVRLTAEKIRDHALASSGLLVDKLGGPSVKPYQPSGLWKEFVGGGGGSTAEYVIDQGEKQYRRSLYTFWKRTVPPPDMLTFDAVTRDFCMVSRETTSTPLQALVLMNSPQIIEASRNLAYRAISNSQSLEERISYMFRSATSRHPSDKEVSILESYFKDEKKKFEQQPTEAEKYLSIGSSPHIDLLSKEEVAAYAMVANTIYNLDESITRS